MRRPLRVGFQVFGGRAWTGGINYLAALLSALAELPERPIEPVLLVEPNADPASVERAASLVRGPPMWIGGLPATPPSRLLRMGGLVLRGRDGAAQTALRAAGIEVLFHHMVWYGHRLGVPTIAWLPDFQHRRLPAMFDHLTWLRREIGYRLLTRYAQTVLVSSHDAKTQCESHYPATAGKIAVLRFAVPVPGPVSGLDAARSQAAILEKYDLPSRYIFFPGQLWKHKNHLGVIDAVKLLNSQGRDVTIVMSGGFDDYRNPNHAPLVQSRIAALGLGQSIRVLGHIPYADVFQLLRGGMALLNPSFSEGWSTTVEEAKSIGVPLVLSNLEVHREQAPASSAFFDPSSAEDMAGKLWQVWCREAAGPSPSREAAAAQGARASWSRFAAEFADIAASTVAGYQRASGPPQSPAGGAS